MLAAEPAQAARWNETLRNVVDLRIELAAWTADDTIGYVQTALVDAGRMEPVFDDDALRALHELSGGVPRQVARLADYALLAGAAAKRDTIDAAIIEAAYDEIAWPATAAVYYSRALAEPVTERAQAGAGRFYCAADVRSRRSFTFSRRISTCFSSASRSMRTRSRIFPLDD